MNIIRSIKNISALRGGQKAVISADGAITYSELWESSDRLAAYLDNRLGEDKTPIAVYGHKDPLMIAIFLACVKSGRAYCPIDTCMPQDRIEDIANAIGNKLVIATAPLTLDSHDVLCGDELGSALAYSEIIDETKWLSPAEVFYIIFTSGSTGKPKGVMITEDNLSRFASWSSDLGDTSSMKAGAVYLNQAPFSFDLSVMDLYTSLSTGATLYCVSKSMQQDVPQMIEYMKSGNINYWVSTPSFADMCLSDTSFNEKVFDGIRAFYFCGEKLTLKTAKKLRQRFSSAKIINTYGPTESTVAVTSVEITDEMLAGAYELPIGYAKPGTDIVIMKDNNTQATNGEKGEIIIVGDTVSPGYFNAPDKTAEAFFIYEGRPAYRTGDEGFIADDGDLFYIGRMNLQVKFHGFRIELGDIENNLMEQSSISAAAVVPKYADQKIRYLAAFIVAPGIAGTYEDRKRVKKDLQKTLPEYMIPRKISYIDKMPLTSNGKINRKELEGLL